MLLSRLLADFTRGQSDTLRKAMGKKQKEKMAELKSLFLEGGQKNGYEAKVLEKIWGDWESFASYAFNKSHATCYSWVAYQTAYLKANYPSEYMAAVLSRNLSDVTKLAKFMDECKNMGIQVLGPDINESYKSFSATKKGDIRFGLGGIKGVGSNAVDAVIAERERGGAFTDIYDFVERVDLSACNRRAVESFALAGAFDGFSEIAREDFFVKNVRDEAFSDVLVKFGQRFQSGQSSMQNTLFGDIEPIEVAKPAITKAEPWSDLERLEKERELVGMYLSAHPLDPYYIEIMAGCNTKLGEVRDHMNELDKELVMGGLVVDFQTRMGKRGQFGIIKVEDYSGAYEFRLFGKDFLEYAKFGVKSTAVVIRAAFQKRHYSDDVDLNVRSIDLLENLKGKMVKNLLIYINDEDLGRVDFMKSHVGASGDNCCELYFRMKDQLSGNYVMLRSKRPISVDKRLLECLHEAGIKFKVNAKV